MGPAGLSTIRSTLSIFSALARSFNLSSALSSSVIRTTKALVLGLPEAAACSSFLTKLVKPGVISRAKTAATGELPSIQTGQAFSPAAGPFTFNGWKGVTAVPGAGLGSAPGARPATRPTATADNKKRLIGDTPFG